MQGVRLSVHQGGTPLCYVAKMSENVEALLHYFLYIQCSLFFVRDYVLCFYKEIMKRFDIVANHFENLLPYIKLLSDSLVLLIFSLSLGEYRAGFQKLWQ